MKVLHRLPAAILLVMASSTALAAEHSPVFDDWRADAPGRTRHIRTEQFPEPFASPSVTNRPQVVPRPQGAALHVPAGFTVHEFASVAGARQIRVAPNGDVFVASKQSGSVTVLRAAPGVLRADIAATFAAGLKEPFGIAFYPLGPDPQWVYVAEGNRVVRFPYRNGDLAARGAAQVIVPVLVEKEGGHASFDIAFSKDGARLLVATGSRSDFAEGLRPLPQQQIADWEAQHGVGATWGDETGRGVVRIYDPEGRQHAPRNFATGIRNCGTIFVHPRSGDTWCVSTERNTFGDDLVPDYLVRVRQGGFYGWPWYYIGGHEDPRYKGVRPDLADKVARPDVLFTPHSSPLSVTFYENAVGPWRFPAEYAGEAFVALHGSWNRGRRAGHKVVRVHVRDGVPTGEFTDFLTGFVVDDGNVWGRPVAVTTAADGSLLVSDDGANAVWKVTYAPPPAPDAAQTSQATQGASAWKFRLEEATIADIQRAILSRQITTEQLVRLYLQRISAYNGACVREPQGLLGPIETIAQAGQLNAISTLNLRPPARRSLGFDDRKARSITDLVDDDPSKPDALEVAAAQDRKFASTGKLVGPLHGVVLAFKDQYDTFDLRTTSGADAFYVNDRPPRDATFVAWLRAAGAIVLAKANSAEYANGAPRSSFGGTSCNPYDTQRSPGVSSSGSASAVAANLVTCAIGEETGSSIRGPAAVNNVVGLSPTQELVSRAGMIGLGINTRVGPICRNVADAARILDVIAGYDPQDPLTVFSIGRRPSQSYASFAHDRDLTGLRIGVVREYMNWKLFTAADRENIEVVGRAVDDLRKLGATVVDPGPEGELFTACLRKYEPQVANVLFTRRYPDIFPRDEQGRPIGDHIAKLLDFTIDPGLVPATLNLRTLGQTRATGETRYEIELYLRRRGDPNIRTNADLIDKANWYDDPQFASLKNARARISEQTELDTAERMLSRFATQQVILQCLEEQRLDALVYPTNSLPPGKLGSPAPPPVNGRGNPPVWGFLGGQGFPTITVPAGFTTQVYDWVRDPGAPALELPESTPSNRYSSDIYPLERSRLEGPTPGVLPVGVDFLTRPFAEPLLFRIASAYAAATRHRRPPEGFGAIPDEP